MLIAAGPLMVRIPRTTRPLLLATLLAATGCASQYAYVPTTNATATIHGKIAADYPIPPNAPQGDLRIASYGITDVSPNAAPRESLRALHLRVALANDSAATWTFDTRQQSIDLSGRGPLAPAFSSASPGTPPPLVTVEPNGKRVVDLFFVLPPDLQHADAIPEFDALWSVTTGAGPIAERTPFERLLIEPDYGYYDYWDYGPDYYWGGPYWVNPAFALYGYPYGYFAGGIAIHRAPRFWQGGHPWHGGHGGYAHGGFHGGAPHGGGHR
jgi:hypothetical protein